jgi:RNA polymerase sigma-70 factor (ECF subfamily)
MKTTEESGWQEWVRSTLREHEGPLVRYAASITGDVEQARDVVQDTFLRLCAQSPARLQGHVVEWLFTVCRHRALDVRRKESRMQPLHDNHLAGCASADPPPSAAAEQAETQSRVLALLAVLPDNQREVVRLKFQNGLSYREISHITNLSVSHVGVLLHTAIKTMRQQFQAMEGVSHET